jgi:hypothetical protein
MNRAKLMRKLMPLVGQEEACILNWKARLIHWFLFPIRSLSWWLSDRNGFCHMSRGIIVDGKRIGLNDIAMLLDGDEYLIQYKGGILHIERTK